MAVPVSKSSREKKKSRIKKNSYISPFNVGIVSKVIFNTEIYSHEDIISTRPYTRMYKNIKTRISNRDQPIRKRNRNKEIYYYRTK